jgi:hypothetical protein
MKFQSLALPPLVLALPHLVPVIGMVGFEWTKNISPPPQSQKLKPILKVQRFQHHRAWKSSAASPWRRIWMTLIKIFGRLQMCVSKKEKERETADLEKERDEWIRKSERETKRYEQFCFWRFDFFKIK